MSRHTVITDPLNTSNSTPNIPKTDGCYFKHFLNENLKGIGTKDKKKIETSCIEILSKCGNSSSDQNREQSDTGIVIGKIQSGKTLSFTGVIALGCYLTINFVRIFFYYSSGSSPSFSSKCYGYVFKLISRDSFIFFKM